MDDVLVFGDRPVRPIRAVADVVNRIVAAQPLEIRVPDIVEIKLRIADIDPLQRHGGRMGTMIKADWSIHRCSPWLFLCTATFGLSASRPASSARCRPGQILIPHGMARPKSSPAR